MLPPALSRMLSAVMYSMWSDRMWPTSCPSTARCSPDSRFTSALASITIIGLPEPIAWAAPHTGEVTYRS